MNRQRRRKFDEEEKLLLKKKNHQKKKRFDMITLTNCQTQAKLSSWIFILESIYSSQI